MPHMKTKIGEYAIIINSQNEFLMVQFPPPKTSWHFPGGRIDEGEEAIEGLIREVKEETNLEITDIKPVFTKIFTIERKYGVFFTAKAKEPYELKASSDHPNVKWFKKEDIETINFWQPFYKKLLLDNL